MVEQVSPYIGEWIEISNLSLSCNLLAVSPYIGEWIEINGNIIPGVLIGVSPYIGEWIEMTIYFTVAPDKLSHLT